MGRVQAEKGGCSVVCQSLLDLARPQPPSWSVVLFPECPAPDNLPGCQNARRLTWSLFFLMGSPAAPCHPSALTEGLPHTWCKAGHDGPEEGAG